MKTTLISALLAGVVACSAPVAGPVELASGQSPTSLATDGANVYWTNADGDVMKCAAAGCDEHPTRVATSPAAPARLAVSADAVYWTAGGVWRAPIVGGEATRFGDASDAFGVALASDRVYWTTNATKGPVMTCPSSGCDSPAELAGGDSSFAIAADDASVYWSDWNAIWTCPLSDCGGAPKPLAAVAGHVALAIDDANVYWAYDDEGLVLACAKAGCGGEPTVIATHQNHPNALASDGIDVYWTSDDGVLRCAAPRARAVPPVADPATGCADQPTVLATPPARDVALDATHVYFASADAIWTLAKTR